MTQSFYRSLRLLWAAVWTMVGLAAALPAADPAVLQAEAERVAMIRRVSPSVVAIFSASGDGGGSGVLISPD